VLPTLFSAQIQNIALSELLWRQLTLSQSESALPWSFVLNVGTYFLGGLMLAMWLTLALQADTQVWM